MADPIMHAMQLRYEAEERKKEMRLRCLVFLVVSSTLLYVFSPYIFGGPSVENGSYQVHEMGIDTTSTGDTRNSKNAYASSSSENASQKALGILDYLFFPLSESPDTTTSADLDAAYPTYTTPVSAPSTTQQQYNPNNQYIPTVNPLPNVNQFSDPADIQLGTNIRYKPTDSETWLPVSPALLFLSLVIIGFAGFCFGFENPLKDPSNQNDQNARVGFGNNAQGVNAPAFVNTGGINGFQQQMDAMRGNTSGNNSSENGLVLHDGKSSFIGGSGQQVNSQGIVVDLKPGEVGLRQRNTFGSFISNAMGGGGSVGGGKQQGPSIKSMQFDTTPVPNEYRGGGITNTFNKFTNLFGTSKTSDDENALRIFEDLGRVSQAFMDCVERNAINFVLGELERSNDLWEKELRNCNRILSFEEPHSRTLDRRNTNIVSVFDRFLPSDLPFANCQDASISSTVYIESHKNEWDSRQHLELFLIHPSFGPSSRKPIYSRMLYFRNRGLRNAYNASHDVSAGYGGGGYSNSGVANAILNQLKKRDKKDQQGQDAGAAKDEAKKDQNTIQQLLGLLSSGGGRGGLKSSDGTEVLTDSHVAENIILKVFESHGADFIKKYIDHSPDPTALNAGSAGGLGRGFSEKETGVRLFRSTGRVHRDPNVVTYDVIISPTFSNLAALGPAANQSIWQFASIWHSFALFLILKRIEGGRSWSEMPLLLREMVDMIAGSSTAQNGMKNAINTGNIGGNMGLMGSGMMNNHSGGVGNMFSSQNSGQTMGQNQMGQNQMGMNNFNQNSQMGGGPTQFGGNNQQMGNINNPLGMSHMNANQNQMGTNNLNLTGANNPYSLNRGQNVGNNDMVAWGHMGGNQENFNRLNLQNQQQGIQQRKFF